MVHCRQKIFGVETRKNCVLSHRMVLGLGVGAILGTIFFRGTNEASRHFDLPVCRIRPTNLGETLEPDGAAAQ